MLYNLDIPAHREQFKNRCNVLYTKRAIVDLRKPNPPKRSLNQNSYVHKILSLFAAELGYRLEEIKLYCKLNLAPDLFPVTHKNVMGYDVTHVRSSAELDTREMTDWIDRIRNCAQEQGIYLPTPDDYTRDWAAVDRQIAAAENYL